MIIIKIQHILDKDERNLNWLSNKTGISYSTLHKLANNKTTSISFSVLDKLCNFYNCKIGDLIEYKKDQ